MNLGRIQSARVERELWRTFPTTPKLQRPGIWSFHRTSQDPERPENVGREISKEKGDRKHSPCHGGSPLPGGVGTASPAIFRSWGRPQQLPLLIWLGKALEKGGTWPYSQGICTPERLWKSVIPAALHISASPEMYRLGIDDPPAGNRDKGHTRCTPNDLSLASFIRFSNA